MESAPHRNIIISAPVTYDTKELKWKGLGLDKVMEEVYRSEGTTIELKESLRVQELEDHPQGERVIAWTHLWSPSGFPAAGHLLYQGSQSSLPAARRQLVQDHRAASLQLAAHLSRITERLSLTD
ncbi:hypothetical protein NDU88_005411 [Pleurodeles waltl]|uniref:Uncharacterized protein n=1 Tax=Pleurodeles waltl TaxID=8319 RepID=A0AAV7TX22_PLEWA|nr:hypothetical protein NDU88_005411 [Pleurodeles waltl]